MFFSLLFTKCLILAVYVNRVLVSTAEDEITRVVGQALGEIANAVYLTN